MKTLAEVAAKNDESVINILQSGAREVIRERVG